jgi:ATP-dependent RNA helicase RhlE
MHKGLAHITRMHMHTAPEAPMGFAQTGLSPEVLAVLAKQGLTVPTPIQEKAIPAALKGGDIIGIAQTGTGKTLAFSLPLIERLRSHTDEIAIVIVPTRELALQVEESIRRISQGFPNMRTLSLIGGMPMYRQIKDLKYHPRILVATPGRLNDHLERRTVRLDKVGLIVLDEADRMLDMGFAPQIEGIMENLPMGHQTMMFSATMAREVSRLVTNYTENPTRIEITSAGTSTELIRQEVCYVASGRKTELLNTLLNKHEGPVLVFTRTKLGAGDLMQDLRGSGHTSAEIHGDRSLYERREALDGFKAGKYRVLIATDVASRGIDVPNISLVINYDLPDANDDYVHRIGRTGRAGSTGLAISFATRGQSRAIKVIEGLVKKQLIVSEHSEAAPIGTSHSGAQTRGGSYRSGNGGSTFSRRPSGFAPRSSNFNSNFNGPARSADTRPSGGNTRPSGNRSRNNN